MPLRIVVAPQAFKGSLAADGVAEAIANGLRDVWPDAAIDLIPVADGGEGTVRALVEATRGEYRESAVRDPLGRTVRARWGIIDDGATAVVEMAAASGLPLLAERERDPLRASSFGTGELLREAARSGARRVIVGLGGSATNDGGAGILRALGLRFVDEAGADVGEGGAALARVHRIEGDVDGAIKGVEILAASDVRNPLTGAEGASAVFG
ncbi:MAG TPA: glycerate kinase, partial [Candidatus Dormibacteraeota bacterium]|nr:glycerate kinase [Candidatus Dormibacteraeota bacterium]